MKKAVMVALLGVICGCSNGNGGPGGREDVVRLTPRWAASACISQLDYDSSVYRAEAWCYKLNGLPSCNCYTTRDNEYPAIAYEPFTIWRLRNSSHDKGTPTDLTNAEPRKGTFCWGNCEDARER